jgi:hypothetical protein
LLSSGGKYGRAKDHNQQNKFKTAEVSFSHDKFRLRMSPSGITGQRKDRGYV